MIKFGTSGYRAIMGDKFTKEVVERIAYGIIEYSKIHRMGEAKVVVGFDNRFMSEMYAKWCIEVLATKFQIKFFVNPVPTPLISYECHDCDFGVMITSSHNPYYYNGVKLFKKGSFEMIDQETAKIAEFANGVDVDKIPHIDYVEALENGRIEKVVDIECYVEAIKKHINLEKVQGSKVKVLINAMHGSGIEALKRLVNDLELKKVEIMCDNVDPYFENSLPAPNIKTLGKQIERIKEEKFDFGFAIDGDGDRFALISSSGRVFDCNFVASILYDYLITKKGKSGAFVKPFAFTSLCSKISESLGEKCFEVWSGFKNIGEKFESENCLIGADATGIALQSHIGSKDGILACALVLEMMIDLNKSFEEILEEKQSALNFKSYSLEKSYEITEKQKAELNARFIKCEAPQFGGFKPRKAEKIEDLKFEFEDGYWALIRLSGTELVLRTYAEMPSLEDCEKVISAMEEFYGLK